MGERALICGQSETGKSVLMMSRADAHIVDGFVAIVHSPMCKSEPWPSGCELYESCDDFMSRCLQLAAHSQKMQAPLKCALFIDEADILLGVVDRENHWLLTRGRHYFPYIYVITQRPKMIAPNVRGQCKELFLFQISADDARELSRDFAADLGEAPHLMQGEHLHVGWSDRVKTVTRVDGFRK